MSNSYNLSDNVNESFSFQLRDKKYVMRYPITEEVQKVQDISRQVEEASKADPVDETRIKQLNQQLEDYLYGFIKPEGHETPIRDALNKENIKVLANFNKMIQAELSLT